MKQLNKKSTRGLRFMATGDLGKCCAISSAIRRITFAGNLF